MHYCGGDRIKLYNYHVPTSDTVVCIYTQDKKCSTTSRNTKETVTVKMYDIRLHVASCDITFASE